LLQPVVHILIRKPEDGYASLANEQERFFALWFAERLPGQQTMEVDSGDEPDEQPDDTVQADGVW
jgi:hypothetical protein